jgi:hypothetical protein
MTDVSLKNISEIERLNELIICGYGSSNITDVGLKQLKESREWKTFVNCGLNAIKISS